MENNDDIFALTPEILELGRWLFTQESTFFKGVVSEKGLPLTTLPEIAFAGRSNVGKSSLINALTNRALLARTSNTPGRTKELNFFDLGERITLVDLPGYGYAKAAKKEVASWQHFTKIYLRGRAQLRRVYILIDARHGIKPTDKEVMKLLDDSAQSYQIVMTKSDKVKTQELQEIAEKTMEEAKNFVACFPQIIITSSSTKEGVDLLRGAIAKLITEIQK
ncbi:MAG: ribosome biogenesis GTP-binding protein YihA/YsxC [Alphaproteobacteria bacterium]|nr:ribosome biogenesis GTP-binding protein YihA/YsxC [Alphaproteobacteria bacterium]